MKRGAYWIVVLVATGCYYDNEALLYPGTACEPVATPSYATHITPILNQRCNNCHGGNSPSANIKLDGYTEVVQSVNNGGLLGSIKHASGFSPMPKNAGKMSVCEIQKIEDWITQGAANN
jgi:mono/diheme cytochrome c family protein